MNSILVLDCLYFRHNAQESPLSSYVAINSTRNGIYKENSMPLYSGDLSGTWCWIFVLKLISQSNTSKHTWEREMQVVEVVATTLTYQSNVTVLSLVFACERKKETHII